MKDLTISLFLLFIGGCSGVQYLGQIGHVKFYSVNGSKIDGPNFNALVSDADGKVTIENIASGPGALSSIASPIITSGGTIGATVLLPKSKGATVNVNNNK